MCYHLSTRLTGIQIQERFGGNSNQPLLFDPVYHVSGFAYPQMPTITQTEAGKQAQLAYWGLIPRWVKDEDTAVKMRSRTLNARSETVTEKPSFRSAVKTNHCLVPATGFFEWHTGPKKEKTPHYIYLKSQEPFAMAGIFEEWLNKATGEWITSFSILTTEANPMMADIHNTKERMPVILSKTDEDVWLAKDVPLVDQLALLQPFPQEEMTSHTISKLITKRGADTNVPAVLQPFAYESGRLF